MKNLKNVVLFSLIAVMTLASSQVFAQSKSALSKDQMFISYVKSQVEFIEKSNSSLVKKLPNQQMKTEKDLQAFHKAFNTNEKEYKSYLEKQNVRLQYLNEKYNLDSYSKPELTGALEPIIGSIGGFDDDIYARNNCERRYINDIASITAAAVIGHIACAPSDVTVIVGLICHAAVTVAQIAANDNATLDYQECLRNGG